MQLLIQDQFYSRFDFTIGLRVDDLMQIKNTKDKYVLYPIFAGELQDALADL